MAWNSQVSHIMATAAQNGSTIVWDLKQKKPWCELRDSNRAPVTDVAWNPEQGQHLVTGEYSTPFSFKCAIVLIVQTGDPSRGGDF